MSVEPKPGDGDVSGSPRFCVLIPAYREGGRIGDCVRRVRAYARDVIVVDDGSPDATGQEAAEAGAHVLTHDRNLGKGAALRTGLRYVLDRGYALVIVMDGDGQHDAADIPGMLAAHAAGGQPVIVGNRMGDSAGMPWVRRLTNRFMSGLLSRRMGQRVLDTQNGFRLFEARVLPLVLRHESEGFAAESEVLLDLAAAGVAIGSAPTRVIYGDERSKIRPLRDTIRFYRMLRRHKAHRLAEREGQGAGQGEPGNTWAVQGVTSLTFRAAVGGVLMGLANLVPGISGGTMLLAAGIYPAFIEAIADVTRLRFRTRPLLILAAVGLSAGLAILMLAGPVKQLVVERRWIMYSLFIGLTLGGAPIVWKMIARRTAAFWYGALAGFAGMAWLAWVQQGGAGEGMGASSVGLLFLAGVAGASAMILPGVSGGYLLLVLGQYIPILSAIDRFKDALRATDVAAALAVGLKVGLPVGLGVLVGIVGVSNLLRVLLRRYRGATLGVLLGLLVGAVVGLWPFQTGVMPRVGEVVKGRVMTEALLSELDPADFPLESYRPTGRQASAALGIVLLGFLVTTAVSRMQGRDTTDGMAG